jgi:hypothetical protein
MYPVWRIMTVPGKDEPNDSAYTHFCAKFYLKRPAYISIIPSKCIFYIVEQRTVCINSINGRCIYASELIKQKKYRSEEGPLLLNEVPSV